MGRSLRSQRQKIKGFLVLPDMAIVKMFTVNGEEGRGADEWSREDADCKVLRHKTEDIRMKRNRLAVI